MKLNLGSGEIPLKDYENLDRKTGQEIYPLNYSDVEEIRASHVLEHFSHTEIKAVLSNWAKALKTGGVLKIAVPNFEWIAQHYLAGNPINVQGYTMGGQIDENDYHKTIFDKEELTKALLDAGLRNVRPWKSEEEDCAALPVSLNLMADKVSPVTEKEAKEMKIGAAMSVPRLGFMDNFFCSFEALLALKIPIRKHTGAFWGQCLERCIEEWIKEGKEWVLTIDYDTIFTRQHVEELIRLAQEHPNADAIAPIQAHRTKPTPLMTIRGAEGKNISEVPWETFDTPLAKINTAHFGLTLIKVEALKKMAKPWFHSLPADDGGWGDGRTDDDIYFWRQWEEAGNSLYLANRVAVGHAELMVRWPDKEFVTTYQHPSEFYSDGPPEDVWK